MNLIVFCFCIIFGQTGPEGLYGGIMKDGHMWKSVTGVWYTTVDSLIAGDAKWDSVTGAKCGDGFRLATLKDYYNTDFEYMEHSEVIDRYMKIMNSGVGVAYTIPSVKDDTDGMTVSQIMGGFFSFWGRLRLRLVITTPLRSPTSNGVWQRGGTYDSITSIPYSYGHETIEGGGHLVACISDTIYGAKPSQDTIILVKTDTILKVDTTITVKVDTIHKVDTISLIKTDTVTLNREIHDTIMVASPHIIVDTLAVVRYDTIIKINTDTVTTTDTVDITIHDTVNTCHDETLGRYHERLFMSKGTYSNTGLAIVGTAPKASPSVEVQTDSYVEIRVYVYDNLGAAVSSGEYTLKPSSRQYITFGGYSESGAKVVSGVYLMRIVSKHNGSISNNVYRVGISD